MPAEIVGHEGIGIEDHTAIRAEARHNRLDIGGLIHRAHASLKGEISCSRPIVS
jgi:hypothetical protein